MSTYDTIIIGGGPAGLSAGLYAARAGLKSILLEKSFLGGQAVTTDRVENYPGFPEAVSGLTIMQNMEKQARQHKLSIEVCGVKALEQQNQNGFSTYLENGQTITAKSIIVATGASPVTLNVAGEKEFTGRGVSYCATCDGPLFRNKEIMVVGGGNSALEEALFLAKFADKVTIIHRRDALRGDKILQDRVFQNPKIHFLWNSVVNQIKGDSLVREIIVQDVKDKSLTAHSLDGVFVYIGAKPNTEWLSPLLGLDPRGFIVTDEKMSTSLPGLFAAGDCRQKPLRQIVTAASDGAVAAMMVYHYLQESA